jgi:hypothetical protein
MQRAVSVATTHALARKATLPLPTSGIHLYSSSNFWNPPVFRERGFSCRCTCTCIVHLATLLCSAVQCSARCFPNTTSTASFYSNAPSFQPSYKGPQTLLQRPKSACTRCTAVADAGSVPPDPSPHSASVTHTAPEQSHTPHAASASSIALPLTRSQRRTVADIETVLLSLCRHNRRRM